LMPTQKARKRMLAGFFDCQRTASLGSFRQEKADVFDHDHIDHGQKPFRRGGCPHPPASFCKHKSGLFGRGRIRMPAGYFFAISAAKNWAECQWKSVDSLLYNRIQ